MSRECGSIWLSISPRVPTAICVQCWEGKIARENSAIVLVDCAPICWFLDFKASENQEIDALATV